MVWLDGEPSIFATFGLCIKGFGCGEDESRLGLLLCKFSGGNEVGLFGGELGYSNSYFDLVRKFWNELLISTGDFSLAFGLNIKSEPASCLIKCVDAMLTGDCFLILGFVALVLLSKLIWKPNVAVDFYI